jgi:hypothetical protein
LPDIFLLLSLRGSGLDIVNHSGFVYGTFFISERCGCSRVVKVPFEIVVLGICVFLLLEW